MSSEASRTTYPPSAPAPRSATKAPTWHAIERRVLLNKIEELDRRSKHLNELETRVQDLNEKVQMLGRLGEATHALHCATTTDELLDTAVRQCVRLLRADNTSILLHDPESHELILAKTHGSHPPGLEGTRIPVGQGIAGYVATHLKPLRVADIASDGRFPIRDSGRYATGSFCAVPVLSNGALLAIVNVSDRSDGLPFNLADLRTALVLCRDLAVAIERVRRFENSRDHHQQFVSKLAHELRNPLDGVLRFINLTLTGPHPEDRRRRYLLASKEGLERLAGIVSSLTHSHRQAGAGNEPGHVNELIRLTVELQEGKAQARNIRVALDLAGGLPPIACAAGLFQVCTNLIANAYDAMQPDGGTLTVTSRRQGERIIVCFADTGCGIEPEALSRIFTPFFTTKAAGEGMGLGLAVCREVVSRVGGCIDVQSEPGAGTTFTITVPWPPLDQATKL